MVAPLRTTRLTLLLRWIAPVRQTPSVTTTRPPPARFGAVAGDVEFAVGELRRLNPFQDLGVKGEPGIAGGPCARTGEGGSGHGCEGMAACVGGHLNRWYGRAIRASSGETFSGV